MKRPIAYVAHPYGGKRDNLESAIAWLRFLYENFSDLDFAAPWIANCVAMPFEDAADRTRALEFDREMVRRCDQLWAVGATISPGMHTEINAASDAGRPWFNLTGFVLHPTQHTLILEAIAARRAQK